MYDDEEIDPEELKDQVNNNSSGLINHNESTHSFNHPHNNGGYSLNLAGIGNAASSGGGMYHSKFNKSAVE